MKNIVSFSTLTLLLLVLGVMLSYFTKVEPKAVGGTTITTIRIYSDLSDGYSKYLGRAGVDSWYDVRNRVIGNQKNDTKPWYMKGILASFSNKTKPLYVISRSFFAFNTSILDDNLSIKSASLCIYGCGANESSVCVVAWTDGEDGVDYDDYGCVGDVNFGNSSSWKNNGYNVIQLNEAGLTYINKTGYTYLACREYEHDFLDNPPGGPLLDENRNGHYFADAPGTDKDPYLLITYTLNPSSNSQNQSDRGYSTPDISFVAVFLPFLISTLFRRKQLF